jgi:D-alanine---D-serine ligase
MSKTIVGVIFGGASSEYEVSLKSACSVLENLDKDKYDVIKIGITREGQWLRYYGEVEGIKDNTWYLDNKCNQIVISSNKGDKEIIEIKDNVFSRRKVDIIFPVLHGKDGEDGSIQGIFEVAGIPYVGCNVTSSAICMDKDYAHKIVDYAGFKVPKSLVINSRVAKEEINEFAKSVGFPIYVKPANEGSSIGITKAVNENELFRGIKEAFKYDNRVVLEENIDGFEVGCAIMGNDDLIVGTVDEIDFPGGFFDFKEKYTLANSKIHLPARIEESLTEKIKETAIGIYKALGCTGLARIDMFLDKNDNIIFNEVNTLPGFTTGSRFPNMLLHSGIEYRDILDNLIKLGLGGQ